MRCANGQVDQALADLNEAIKCDPNNGMAYIAMGAALNNQEKYDDALRALDRGVGLMPNAWQPHFELARTKLAKADYAAALRDLDKAQQFANLDYAPMHL